MKRKTLALLALCAGLPLWAETPEEPPAAGTTAGVEALPETPAPKSPEKEPSRGWRGRGRPSEAAKGLPKKQGIEAPPSPSARPKFAPGKAADAAKEEDVATPGSLERRPSPSNSADAEGFQQWRRSPPDRRWESWREFPVEKQVDLWRKLEASEREAYWAGMNVHERSTLWSRMTEEEKETYWAALPEADRRSLCAVFPPKEKAFWEPRLARNSSEAREDPSGKFRPATPAPGFQPKSSYREDDEE